MSREKVALTAAACAAVTSVGLYSSIRGKKDPPEEPRNRAQVKRDLGLGAAGIGGNMMSGGPEQGVAPSHPDKDPNRRPITTASKEELPSGGVGGGEGAGGTSARKVQLPSIGSVLTARSDRGEDADAQITTAARRADTKTTQKPPEQPGVMGSIQGYFRQGGKKTSSRPDESGFHETRGISKMGSETPSKRGPPDASD